MGFYTKREEQANTLTHAAGIGLGIAGGWVLLNAAREYESGWAIWSVLIYLFGMLFSYIASTCYHGCIEGDRKQLLRKLDHSAIYMHISGTYAPFTLLVLRDVGIWGWTLFIFNWLAAFTGLYMSFRKLQKHSHLETICFVLLGCSIFVAFGPLIRTLEAGGQLRALNWLIAGGAAYIIGALFYSLTHLRYMHTVFHLFVLAGSFCHMTAIYLIL